jgi:choline-sulfatase
MMYDSAERPRHPFIDAMRTCFVFDEPFDAPMVRRAIAAYMGLVSFLDDNVGRILRAIEEAGLADNTRVIYGTDHGDNLGTRGMWGKSTMYEEIARVPMILAGPGVPQGRRVDTPASHVDAFPTILESAGVDFARVRDGHPGVSLFDLADGAQPKRTVLSEYHGMGSTTGAFAIRHGRYKYVHYAKYPPQLFDLERDPEEIDDLAGDPAHAGVVAQCRSALYAVLDPVAVDERAKRRQAELLERNGGRQAVIDRGDLGFTPAPGQAVDFQ